MYFGSNYNLKLLCLFIHFNFLYIPNEFCNSSNLFRLLGLWLVCHILTCLIDTQCLAFLFKIKPFMPGTCNHKDLYLSVPVQQPAMFYLNPCFFTLYLYTLIKSYCGPFMSDLLEMMYFQLTMTLVTHNRFSLFKT